MNKMQWLVFQPEGVDVLYIYHDGHVYTMHVARHEGALKDWLWLGPNGANPEDPREKAILEDAYKNKRKQLLKFTGRKRRYSVVARGEYDYQNVPA